MRDESEKTLHVYSDGTTVPPGLCVAPDHYVTTVQVTFRSSDPIDVETLRRRLKEQNEVIGIFCKETVCVVQKP